MLVGPRIGFIVSLIAAWQGVLAFGATKHSLSYTNVYAWCRRFLEVLRDLTAVLEG